MRLPSSLSPPGLVPRTGVSFLERHMTKADRIRELAKQELSDREIAGIVAKEFGACAQSYVRTVARQRVNGMSESDRRYGTSAKGKSAARVSVERFIEQHGCWPGTMRRRNSPEARAKAYAASRAWVDNNLERRRKTARDSARRCYHRKKAEREATHA
jgi:hypothetical protein